MRGFLHFLAVSALILVAMSIDSITALIFSNPYTAFLGYLGMWFGLAALVAVFLYSVKQILLSIDKDRD